MKKDYAIFSLRIAHQLTKKGFEVKNTGINTSNPKYKVFYFENSDELREAVRQLTASKQF